MRNCPTELNYEEKKIKKSSVISSLKELKEKKLVTMSPYPSNRGSSQPAGSKRNREDEEVEDDTERSVRARSVSRSCLPRKTLSGYFSRMETPSRVESTDGEHQGIERKESEPDTASGSKP